MFEAHSSPLFPYGTVPVEDDFLDLYDQEYLHADRYALPESLPLHHPVFRQLEGVYPFQYHLPPWWPSCLQQIQAPEVRHLLAGVAPDEFRTGCIQTARWKPFRLSLCSQQRLDLPSSPKIAALLEGLPHWSYEFKERGAVDIPEDLSLIISTHPQAFLFLSNGRDWSSCQHYTDGSENECLPGNFYDTGVAVALLLATGTHVEDPGSVLARTTLRLFQVEAHPVVAIGRTYHNHNTLAYLLLAHLAEMLDAQALRWGMLTDVETLSWCTTGRLGPALGERLEDQVRGEGEPFFLPEQWFLPYIDGGEHQWHPHEGPHRPFSCHHLEANLKLMRPVRSPRREQSAYAHPCV